MAIGGRWGKTLLLVLAVGAGAWWLSHREDSRTKRLVNQIWIERLPRNERDMIWGGVLVEEGKDRIGAIVHGSQWRAHSDLLLWRLDGNLLHTRLLQDDRRFDFKARTWECAGKAPEPFELCLELERRGRVLRFFSRKEWELGSQDLPAVLSGFVPERAALVHRARGQEVGDGAESDGPDPFGD
jgi:hypothetical protein